MGTIETTSLEQYDRFHQSTINNHGIKLLFQGDGNQRPSSVAPDNVGSAPPWKDWGKCCQCVQCQWHPVLSWVACPNLDGWIFGQIDYQWLNILQSIGLQYLQGSSGPNDEVRRESWNETLSFEDVWRWSWRQKKFALTLWILGWLSPNCRRRKIIGICTHSKRIIARGGLDDEKYAKFLEHSKTTHALGRVGQPEEVTR